MLGLCVNVHVVVNYAIHLYTHQRRPVGGCRSSVVEPGG